MGNLFSTLVMLAIVGGFLFIAKDMANFGSIESGRYFARKTLLSEPEQVLYLRLVQALPRHLVFSQVQLSRVIWPNRSKDYRRWLNKIDRKSLDFVVCEMSSKVVAVIELDDASHDKPDRRKADNVKDEALRAAKVRIIRWHVRNMPSVEEIREALA